MNKKAAEMTIGTIVIIILALVVLVVIIYGFTVGWNALWQNIVGFGGEDNVQANVRSCEVACTAQEEYDYCTRQREIKFDADPNNLENQRTWNCKQLEQRVPSVGLSCPSISCILGVYACEDGELESAACALEDDVANCKVMWMLTNDYERKSSGRYLVGEQEYSKMEIMTNVISEADKATHDRQTCVLVIKK